MFESGRNGGGLLQARVVGGFCYGRRDVADPLKQAAVVEPVDPFQRGVLNGFKGSPRPAPMDHLGFAEPVDRLGERVVVALRPLPEAGF